MAQLRNYIDFKLYLSRADGADRYQAALLPTPEVGESIVPVSFSLASGAFQENLPYLASKSISLFNLARVGKQFADWIMPQTSIGKLFEYALLKAGNRGGVRLRLIIADPVLKQVPWEFIFNPFAPEDNIFGFLALDPRVSIVRHEPLAQPHTQPIHLDTPPTRLRMMAAAAAPDGTARLAVDQELERLATALGAHPSENAAIELVPQRNATWESVKNRLDRPNRYHIFHFSGHGETKTAENIVNLEEMETGALLFLDGNGRPDPVSASSFATQMQQANIWLVTLGACLSGERSRTSPWHGIAGALLYHNIPVVVAMQNAINDSAAVTFSREFYGKLESGLSLDEAMSWSRRKMASDLLQNGDAVRETIEWGLPVLYSRLPDGVLLPDFVQRGSQSAIQTREQIQRDIDSIIKVEQTFKSISGKAVGVAADGKNLAGKQIEIKQRGDNIEPGGEVVGVRL